MFKLKPAEKVNVKQQLDDVGQAALSSQQKKIQNMNIEAKPTNLRITTELCMYM